jgi:Holliday junction DNA helicase RuvA
MFEYLRGIITELSPAQATVECAGVGYAVQISLQTYGKLIEGEERRLYVHPVYREDAQLLFGFIDRSERRIFQLLLSVSGIGPNTARLILSSLTAEEVTNALQSGDVMRFQSVKGVGAKTAQRLIVDLRDKVGAVEMASVPGVAVDAASEALEALVVLGYNRQQAQKAVHKARQQDAEASVESLIRNALQIL